MLHANPPGIGPELVEGLKKAGSGEGDLVVADLSERIISKSLLQVWRVEVDNFARLFGHRDRGNTGRQIAMWVDQSEAAACTEVPQCKCFKKRRFSNPGLADDVHVGKAVSLPDTEKAIVIVEVGPGKVGYAVVLDFGHSEMLVGPPSIARIENEPSCTKLKAKREHRGAMSH